MTDRDLTALLERATEDVVERDFAENAWAAALAARRHRRRTLLTGVGAVAVAALAVTAVQLGGADHPKPTPATSSTTSTTGGTLSDGTAYAVMPQEGTEGQLRDFDAGLPSTIDVRARAEAFSAARPPGSVVAVYLRADGDDLLHPVLVAGDGRHVLMGDVDLVRTTDASGNEATPLGPRAVGGGGRYVVFPQRDHVLRLDAQTGDTVSYPVPAQHVEWAGWNAAGTRIVARASEGAWSIDPSTSRAEAVPVVGGYEGTFRVTATDALPSDVRVTRFDEDGRPLMSTPVRGPTWSLWGETVNTETLAATGAFFDQNVTSKVIRRGYGPIYQGLLVVEPSSGAAKVLLAPENPDGQTGRVKGCCTVLGWADADTVLFQSLGSHGRWVLAWKTTTGEVFEVARITTSAPDDPVTPIALNVGRRS
ncbi:hypothetical protein SAMN04489867_1444 [Pedococcus dokdonensis]|uniref:Uncharacterized protein n=1 Tax=Pedococcus dokdonensis TaxID=443156 RepID=A0A1H0Q2Y4_9MICO|nr:hypothetical protein [Pedococcus dokdonensis]SDP11028.1 hypothetical protein SAMN04489867_1444 [Pedococcus dokdonensis]